MVKGYVKIAPVAQYEAEQRTVRVSMKPAVGKQIISDQLMQVAASSPCTFSPHFDAERFIFGKIREYTLRAAAHGDNVGASTAVRNVDHSTDHIHESLRYRVAAQAILQRCRVSSTDAPKHLLGHVAGLMLRDGHVPICRTENIQGESQSNARVGDESQLSSALKASVRAHRFHMSVKLLLKSIAVAAAGAASSSSDHCSISFRKGSDASVTERVQSCLMFVLAILNSSAMRLPHNKARNFQSNHLKIHDFPDQNTKVQAECASTSAYAAGPWLGLKKEAGFGTAPIWYQQSMANGPPAQTSRWTQAMHTN
jgi:hypothetical protein